MNGTQKIEHAFEKNRSIKLMTHIVAGFPSLGDSEAIVRSMASNGADLVEIQIPFSDPTADGPSIVGANTDALATGITTVQAIEMAGRVAQSVDIPILLMSYLNPIFTYGAEKFVDDIRSLGISGVIVPDCPPEENFGLTELCNDARIASVPLVAPMTSPERVSLLSAQSLSPFVYAVMRLGVTGKKTELSKDLSDYLAMVKKQSGRYVAAGFGIRESSQVSALNNFADCAIVGSAVTDCVRLAHDEKRSTADAAGDLVKKLKSGV
jgi:tryptophan synthase alpha chain